MAGGVQLRVRDTGVERALTWLANAHRNLFVPALKNIGEGLLKSTFKRFDQQKAPDGTPWTPLHPEYAKGKKGSKMMQEQGMRGGLLGSFVYQIQGDRLVFGTNKKYAAAQHFGATIVPKRADALVFKLNGRLVFARKVTIPARPIIGISDTDRTMITEVVEDIVNDASKPR